MTYRLRRLRPGQELAVTAGIAGETIARSGHTMLHADDFVFGTYLKDLRRAAADLNAALAAYDGATDGHDYTSDTAPDARPDQAEAPGS